MKVLNGGLRSQIGLIHSHRGTRYGAREEMLGGGAKIIKVPTASEASKIFTGHTLLIGSKFDKKCRQCKAIFKKSSADGEAQGSCPQAPLVAPSLLGTDTAGQNKRFSKSLALTGSTEIGR